MDTTGPSIQNCSVRRSLQRPHWGQPIVKVSPALRGFGEWFRKREIQEIRPHWNEADEQQPFQGINLLWADANRQDYDIAGLFPGATGKIARNAREVMQAAGEGFNVAILDREFPVTPQDNVPHVPNDYSNEPNAFDLYMYIKGRIPHVFVSTAFGYDPLHVLVLARQNGLPEDGIFYKQQTDKLYAALERRGLIS